MSQTARTTLPQTTTAITPLDQPHDLGAEMLFLGRLLALGQDPRDETRGNTAYLTVQTLAVSDFYERKHGLIWRAMQKVIEAGGLINITSLEGEFLKAGVKDVTLADMEALIVNPKGNLKECKKRIATAALRRKALAASKRMAGLALDTTLTPDQLGEAISDESSRFLLQVQALSDRRNVTLFDNLDTHAIEFEKNRQAQLDGAPLAFGIPSGYPSIDYEMGMNGFKRATVSIVVGRPGTGKTSWMLNLGLNALHAGARVTFIPLEMTALEMTNRLIGIESGLDTIDLATGNVHPDNMAYLLQVRKRMKEREASKAFVYLDLPPRPTLAMIESRLMEHISTIGTDLIIFDQMSLQLVSRGKLPKGEDFVAEMVATAKAWVHPKMFNVPLIAGAQENRVGEANTGAKSTATIANSDSVGQTADVVFMLERDKTKTLNNGVSPTIVHLAKHRGGREGPLNFLYHTSSTKFEEAR